MMKAAVLLNLALKVCNLVVFQNKSCERGLWGNSSDSDLNLGKKCGHSGSRLMLV